MDQSDFHRLWAMAEPRLRTFLAATCCDATLVEDLVQDVAMTAWRKPEQLDLARSFTAWVIGMARFAMLRHRRDLARQRVILSPDLIERLEALTTADEEPPDDRRRALADCLNNLGDSAKALLEMRYKARTPLAEASLRLGRTHGAVRTALARLRDSLRRCVGDRLAGRRGDPVPPEEL